MDALHLIGTVTGLGFLAGLRLYATVLALGLAVRFELIHLRPEFEQLHVFGSWWIIGLAGVAFLVEFFADKIPWVDSAWDSIHTVIRPLGAALIGFAAIGDVSPLAQVAVAILTGGAALTSHSVKAASRLAVNQSPEPLSNSLLSLAGDVAVPIGVWLTMEHPLLVGGFVAVFVLVFLAVSPLVFRMLRVQTAATTALFRGWFGMKGGDHEGSVPERYAAVLQRELNATSLPPAARVVAGKGVGRLKNSIGYLVFLDEEAAFVTRRWFRYRLHRIALAPDTERRYEKGLLMDRVSIRTAGQTFHFSVFKDSDARWPASDPATTPSYLP